MQSPAGDGRITDDVPLHEQFLVEGGEVKVRVLVAGSCSEVVRIVHEYRKALNRSVGAAAAPAQGFVFHKRLEMSSVHEQARAALAIATTASCTMISINR